MSTRPNSSSKAKLVLLVATLGILFVGLELGLRALGLPPDSRFEQRTQYVGLRVQAPREPLPNTAHEGGAEACTVMHRARSGQRSTPATRGVTSKMGMS